MGRVSPSQTARSFADKWSRNPDLAFRQTLDPSADIHQWILRRNGFEDGEALRAHLADRARILDAGSGNGRVTALLAQHAPPTSEVVGVDINALDVARENLAGLDNVSFREANLLGDLSHLGSFDFVYSQEVLHHTGDAPRAFANLATVLAPGGELAIYVYRVKAPAREFADDHIRRAIADLPYEEAMEECRRIAEVGRALSELGATVTVPDVPSLGIEAGEYDVQRFVYHFFMKCFWSDELDAEGNAVLNYDWYHPEQCSRHTVDEVRGWFADAGLALVHEHVDPYGITMRGRRG
jgi:SAM-dependent methyltransferase